MSVKLRQELERRILSRFVDDALAAGRRLAVSLDRGYDTNEMLLGSRDRENIIEEAIAGDECHIFVQPPTGPTLDHGLGELRHHIHQWGENDYCLTCGADGRA